MHDILKVLNKAVNKNGGIFSHLNIDHGTVEANNGRIGILAQVPELAHIKALVPADKFTAAIRACKGAIDIKTTDSSLMVKSGSFSARIPLNAQEFPALEYTAGAAVDVPQGFIDKLAIAQQFATSEQFNGVLLRGERIYGVSPGGAVALDSAAVPSDIVLPIDTVADMVSIKEQPTALRVSDQYAIIEYASFKLRTSLVDKRWPDADQFLAFDRDQCAPITDTLREALDVVLPFADNTKRITFSGEALSCGEAVVDGIDVPESAFNGDNFSVAIKYTGSMGMSYKEAQGKRFAVGHFFGDGIVAVVAGMV